MWERKTKWAQRPLTQPKLPCLSPISKRTPPTHLRDPFSLRLLRLLNPNSLVFADALSSVALLVVVTSDSTSLLLLVASPDASCLHRGPATFSRTPLSLLVSLSLSVCSPPATNKFELLEGFTAMGEVSFMQEEDTRLEATRTRFANVLKRHVELTERLSRDSDKMIFERLLKEFEASKASQTQEICLDGEDWNDGLLATIRERVHMEADRKATSGESNGLAGPLVLENITYKVGTKVICCLGGARIGIQYETSFAGEPCELYHCVLESKSFLEKMTVHEHTVPFFLPIREAETDLLTSNAKRFIDYIGDLLQAYVERREQVRLIKELYGNQIRELYHSLPYHMVEFALDDSDCKITVSIRYADLLSVLPSRVRVLAWPTQQLKKNIVSAANENENETAGPGNIPAHLSYAEDALRTLSLPEAYAEIVLNLPQALKQIYQVGS